MHVAHTNNPGLGLSAIILGSQEGGGEGVSDAVSVGYVRDILGGGESAGVCEECAESESCRSCVAKEFLSMRGYVNRQRVCTHHDCSHGHCPLRLLRGWIVVVIRKTFAVDTATTLVGGSDASSEIVRSKRC